MAGDAQALLGGQNLDVVGLLQALSVPVFVADTEGRITFYNDAATQLWGYRPALGEARWCGAWKLFDRDGVAVERDRSPMALCLAGKEVTRGPLVAERPDGSRVSFEAHPRLVRNREGKVVGGLSTLLDLSTSEKFDAAQNRLAAIVESSADAIIGKDLNSIIRSWNDGAQQLFGYTAEEAIGQSVTMLIPSSHVDEEAAIIARIRNGDRVESYETIRRRKNGELFPVSLTVSPIRDWNGRIVGASKIARDITYRRDSEQRIRLLMREVNHRVKNQYSVILSMIRETNKRSSNPADFERQVRERIMALSRSHDLLVMADWRGSTVFDLLLEQIKPFGADEIVVISGPPVILNPNAVQYLGIAFHELATNSAKHGVLSSHRGKVSITWHVDEEPDGTRRFRLVWLETGGPPAPEERGSGFGTVVLERVAPQSISGTGTVEYSDRGVTWTLEAPMKYVEGSLED